MAASASPSKRSGSTISVRLAPAEAERLREAASARGESLSDFVRNSVLAQRLTGSTFTLSGDASQRVVTAGPSQANISGTQASRFRVS